jgi:hypothetical protein
MGRRGGSGLSEQSDADRRGTTVRSTTAGSVVSTTEAESRRVMARSGSQAAGSEAQRAE